MAKKEPLGEPPESRRRQDGDDRLVLRRREADWTEAEREPELDVDYAVVRAAVDVAASALAAHDGLTAGHSDDVVTVCAALATRLDLPELSRARLLAAAKLHDLGKVAVPQQVLEKDGPLDQSEWTLMYDHTLCGQRILETVPELAEVGRIVRHTHERWDGSGYPDGLAGEAIPLESRIVFCADAFHAIRCDRPYRVGRSAELALKELRRNAGSQFDPEVIDAIEEEAASLRNSPADRLAAMTSTVRSKRLVALLLSLIVSATALAAPGSPLRGGDGRREAVADTRAACADPCVSGSMGALTAVKDAATGAGDRPGAIPAAGPATHPVSGVRRVEPHKAEPRRDRTAKRRRVGRVAPGAPAGARRPVAAPPAPVKPQQVAQAPAARKPAPAATSERPASPQPASKRAAPAPSERGDANTDRPRPKPRPGPSRGSGPGHTARMPHRHGGGVPVNLRSNGR